MSQTAKTRHVRARAAIAVITAASLFGLAGCASGDSSGEGGEEAVTYVVGFPALLSGPAAFAGVPIADGAKLAVKEINESGYLGEGSTIDLKIDDIKGDPAQAIALFNQYAADGASGILCCGLSSEAGALAPVITEQEDARDRHLGDPRRSRRPAVHLPPGHPARAGGWHVRPVRRHRRPR